MSHFSTIKTKIKERPYLIEALEIMGHDVQENQNLVILTQLMPRIILWFMLR